MKLNIVPARTGVQWVKLGMRTFSRQPLALAGLFFMYMAVVVMVAQVPVVGMIIGGMLVPAATLGLMAATAEASKGRFPMPSVLISAFRAGRQRVRAMLFLGLFYTIGSMLATWIATALSGTPQQGTPGDMSAGMLLALVLHAPLFLMFWHAPALVHWHGVSPAKSMFFSMVACLRNMGAFLVYGLTWLLVFLGVGTVLGLLGGIIGGPEMARAVMMPTALLLAAMFSTSIYFTFVDSFAAGTAEETAELPPPSAPEDAP
jgi:hypothetical protein